MATFILDVLKDLKKQHLNLAELTFILPSKRAGVFLKHQLHKVNEQTAFAPNIVSIEEFTEELSQLKIISNTELLFEFYEVYCDLTPEAEKDSFEIFSKWAQIILQDFNEIDRYLISQQKIFSYLTAIQDLKHWSLENNKTDFVKKYLAFWNKLHIYYAQLTQKLLDKKRGYQGLIYREAVENLETYIGSNNKIQHIFLGFNALNSSEETIIQELLQNELAKIYWDIDAVFINNPLHDAALFTRAYKLKWHYFKNNPFNWITNNYSNKKNISVYGVPKNIGQAKYIGIILDNLKKQHIHLDSTAVILGDESLLIPVLNSLPQSIDALNITMGLPLKSIPLASLFEHLFRIHKKSSHIFYYKDVISIISHPFIRPLFNVHGEDLVSKIIEDIHENNLIYISLERLKKVAETHKNLIDILFSNWLTSDAILKNCSLLIITIKNSLDKDKTSNLLPLEYLFRFNVLFNELQRLNAIYNHIKSIQILYEIYREFLNTESLDFQGEPLQGLQIMGMLESRALDFETVIISSVNEGILPSGKSNNSFIPFDVKLENNLPTFKEKDAVYTYHFYRLLQRAKNIYILYNTEADILKGGEKSRFITQLELEDIHKINHQIITPYVPLIKTDLNTVIKDGAVIEKLIKLAAKGFSPSSLTNYIRNPIEFYNQKILGIQEYEDAEETVAANTLGTVVHNTLEEFYKPFVGSYLTVDSLIKLKSGISNTVAEHFKKVYKEGDISKGKNLIIFEIAKRYVSNFIDLEIADLKAGRTIKILSIETNINVIINIPELHFPVYITGKVDRVDEYDGVTRIIDYKTGKVQQNQVEIVNWEEITTNYDAYSKSFQILTYAYMMQLSGDINLPVEAGIISFKSLNSGLLRFAKKDKTGNGAKKDYLITSDTLEAFEIELKKLIIDICNPQIPFIEKEIKNTAF